MVAQQHSASGTKINLKLMIYASYGQVEKNVRIHKGGSSMGVQLLHLIPTGLNTDYIV